MTERLYYADPQVAEFEAQVTAVAPGQGRIAVLLDRTAFYPTSGGQLFDTGWLEAAGKKLRVCDVSEHKDTKKDTKEDMEVLHWLELSSSGAEAPLVPGDRVRGIIDVERRRDHMQQHTGQHLLSAAFIEVLNMPTVSFHMGDESCTIDLSSTALTPEQAAEVELRVNHVVWEGRPVRIRFSTPEQALALGVRKLPPGLDNVRLIDIQGIDLTACGGTHVASTAEVGSILIRKVEKVRQGMRVEFVCGERAVRTAGRDQRTLRAAGDLLSAHMWEVPQQIVKLLDEVRTSSKREETLKAELAELHAGRFLEQAELVRGKRVVCHYDSERDAAAIRLLAQKLTLEPDTVVLLGSGAGAAPRLVFGQSSGGGLDLGALMKRVTSSLGGRGGGNRDMAQGGAPAGADVQSALDQAVVEVRRQLGE